MGSRETYIYELIIEYRFEAESYQAAVEKAQHLGFLDESDEVQVHEWTVKLKGT